LINNDACDQIRIVSVSGDADSVDLKTGALDAQCPYPADFSPNGQFVHLPWGGVYDARTGERVIDFLSEDPSVNYLGWRAAFTADGSELIVGGGSGRVFVFDLPALLDGETADTALIRTIDAHDSFIVALNLSPDESLISTAAQNEPARLWNRDAGDLLGEFGGLPGNNKINWASFHPTLPQLMVSTPSGEIRIHTLDTSDLLTIAAATLSREITDEECERYLRGPCTGIPVPETSR
jgi:WD40 repeat protein